MPKNIQLETKTNILLNAQEVKRLFEGFKKESQRMLGQIENFFDGKIFEDKKTLQQALEEKIKKDNNPLYRLQKSLEKLKESVAMLGEKLIIIGQKLGVLKSSLEELASKVKS